jgi:hypothetical protein
MSEVTVDRSNLESNNVTETDESATGGGNVASTSDVEQHPWPYMASLFKFMSADGKTYKFQCLLCEPKRVECSAYISSPSNLRKHIQVFELVT